MAPNLASFVTVLLGDLHGRRDLLLKALNDTGLTDPSGRWIGGDRRLIQLGDLVDRGPEPLGALDLLMQLQAEAGDRVTVLLGNHEWMALRAGAGDHLSRLSWLLNGAGADLQEWAARRGITCDETEAPYPEEFYAEFGPEGRYGRWLRTLPVACRAGDYVAVHAGWTPSDPDAVELANALLLAASAGFLAALDVIQQLVWVRNQPEGDVAEACARLGCRALITGHTPQPGIRVSCGGKLVQVDTGMQWTSVWTGVGIADDGSLWAFGDGQEPVLLDRDQLCGLPAGAQEMQPEEGPPAPAYGPGQVIRLFRAGDGAWAQYLHVHSLGEMYSYPFYVGKFLTLSDGVWSSRPGQYYCVRVDRFGRPAAPGEVPEDLLQ